MQAFHNDDQILEQAVFLEVVKFEFQQIAQLEKFILIACKQRFHHV